MATHHPPALSVTVSRANWQAYSLWFLWLLGLAATVSFVVMQTTVLQRVVVVLSCVVSGVWAWQYLQVVSSGRLHWDGAAWYWTHFDGLAAQDLAVILDFQRFMLVRLQTENGQTDWLWLYSPQADASWLALRRALVFASKKTVSHA